VNFWAFNTDYFGRIYFYYALCKLQSVYTNRVQEFKKKNCG